MKIRDVISQEIFVRLMLLFCGLTIAHLGVTLFLLANLGSDPFNVFVQGLNHFMRNFNMTHGIIHMCISFMIILVLLVTDRHYIRVGTIVCMFCGGSDHRFVHVAASGTRNRKYGIAR